MAANPLNRNILRTVMERPLQAPEGPYVVSAGGREALFVAVVVERWLQNAPRGAIEFEGKEAEAAVGALAEGWSATVVHMLARRPRTSRELHRAVEGVGRRELRRHLSAMQRAGLVEVRPAEGGEGAIYAVTDWLRAGIAPLAASARAERRDPQEGMAPIDELDVEAAFLLTLPLLELPKELSGACRLGVNLEDDEDAPIDDANAGLTGVTVRIDQGRVVSCEPVLDLRANAWGAGTAGDWLDAVIEPDADLLRTGGDRWLAAALRDALHETLFGLRMP